MTLIGVTDASAEEIHDYRDANELEFPILAEAAATRTAWGVDMIWGNVVRLVNPEGLVVAESLSDAARILASRCAIQE